MRLKIFKIFSFVKWSALCFSQVEGRGEYVDPKMRLKIFSFVKCSGLCFSQLGGGGERGVWDPTFYGQPKSVKISKWHFTSMKAEIQMTHWAVWAYSYTGWGGGGKRRGKYVNPKMRSKIFKIFPLLSALDSVFRRRGGWGEGKIRRSKNAVENFQNFFLC